MCAFANDMNNWGGGYIIVGIAEKNGRPLLPPQGLNPDRIDDMQGELTNLGHRIHPHYLPIPQPYEYNLKQILIIWAPAGDMRPYSAPAELGKTKQHLFYYVRSGSKTIRAQGENLRRLQELTARTPFDDRINQQAVINVLDLGLLRDFLHEIKSSLAEESAVMSLTDLAQQLALVKGPNEQLRPVNVGLMFFNKTPEKFFRNTWIEVVIRKDEVGKDFTEKYFKGPLHIQLRNALRYIESNVIEERVSKVSGKAEANRYYNFPYDALEEALANAVYHKSYELPNPIEVQVWMDRIEVLSFPGPVPPVDAKILAENKRIVARDYRNRRVGDFLKELHLTEGRGTGIPTMRKAMANNGSPEPVLQTDEQCTYFLTTLPVHPAWLTWQNENHERTDQEPIKNRLRTDQVPIELLGKLEEMSNLLLIIKGEMGGNEMLDKLNLKHKPHFRQNYLKPSLEAGFIEMTIPQKPRSSNIN